MNFDNVAMLCSGAASTALTYVNEDAETTFTDSYQKTGIGRTPHVYRIFRVGGADHDCYVGSTTGTTNRAYFHAWHLSRNSHHSPRLQAAWNKYGAARFRYEVLEITGIKELRDRERCWMTAFAAPAATLPRYNCSEETNQPPHWTPTEATRAKWSEQRLGKHHTLEAKLKIATASRSRRHSLATIQKMREIHRGRRPGDVARRRSREATHARFQERIRLATAWCEQRQISQCPNGASLIFHMARCLNNETLRRDERLPSIGALAKALGLSVATVSLTLRRRAPVIRGLTIVADGMGLVVAHAAEEALSQPLSFYAMSTAARISKVHRDRGVRPTQHCHDMRRKHFAKRSKIADPRGTPLDEAVATSGIEDAADWNAEDA